jgi:hypothetical protein
VVLKPKVFAAYKSVVLQNSFLLVQGKLQIEEGVANVIARHIEGLERMPSDRRDSDDVDGPMIRSRNFH